MSDFNQAMIHILDVEGGYSNDAADSGGPTNYGITQADLASWRGHAVTAADVKALTKEGAGLIYKAKYWDKMKLDQVTGNIISLVIFDQGVNRGTVAAIKDVQRILGNVAIDGVMGPKTVAAVNAQPEKKLSMKLIEAAQLKYVGIVKSKPSQIVFLVGWLNRTHVLLDYLV